MQEATQDYIASWNRAEPLREESPSDKPQALLKEELGMAFAKSLPAERDADQSACFDTTILHGWILQYT